MHLQQRKSAAVEKKIGLSSKFYAMMVESIDTNTSQEASSYVAAGTAELTCHILLLFFIILQT